MVLGRRAFLYGVGCFCHVSLSHGVAKYHDVCHHCRHYCIDGNYYVPTHWGAVMVCPCCLPNTCNCAALRGVYVTLKTTVEPFSATATFPSCANNSTFSTTSLTEETTFRLSDEPGCQIIAFGEAFASSGTSRPFYSVSSNRRVLVYASGCQLYVRIYYDGFPPQDSRINCPVNNEFYQRWHFVEGTGSTGATDVNDLSPTSEEYRLITSSASEVIGLKATHDPLTNVDCSNTSNWPNLPAFSFCESGGKLTAEITSVSLLP